MLFQRKQSACIVICTPMPAWEENGVTVFDTISPRWHRARMGLRTPTNFNTVEVLADGMEVGHARSHVAAQCLASESRPEFLFFIDYDVLLPHDALTKLFFRARCFPEYDVFAGVYCHKGHTPPEPLIYGEHGHGTIWDWTVGDLLTTESHGVKSVHMGLTLIRVSVLQKLKDAGLVGGDGTDMADRPFFMTTEEEHRIDPVTGGRELRAGTEDIFFCDLLDRLGAKILVDTSVLAGHEDKRTGVVYGLPYDRRSPWERAKWLPGPDGKTPDSEYGKIALDIGAGGERRTWEGHKTYTTDIRADTKPDYVQDTRLLNLPDDHFDLVASSHHLEHIGRWDQETVWREIFKVCKPGGKIEHVVPNVEWAAAKIMAKEVDGHVLNVLYGAQEAHGYARQFNLHYFGYTPAVAVALAEQAGFEDVVTEDWHTNPDLGYNLIIRGTKPARVEAKPEPFDDEDTPLDLAAEVPAESVPV